MSLENLQSINWDTVELETVNPYMQRRIVTGERMTVARIYLKDGFLVPMHSHVHEQITQVISGSMRFTFGEDRSEVTEIGPADHMSIFSTSPIASASRGGFEAVTMTSPGPNSVTADRSSPIVNRMLPDVTCVICACTWLCICTRKQSLT